MSYLNQNLKDNSPQGSMMKINNFTIPYISFGMVVCASLLTAALSSSHASNIPSQSNTAGLEQNIKIMTITTVSDKEIKKLDDENNEYKKKAEEYTKLAAAQKDDSREIYNALARSYERLIELNEIAKQVWQSIVELSK